MEASRQSGRWSVLRVFLLAFVIYAYFMPQWADWNIDSRLDLTHAILDRGSLNINITHWNTWDKALYKRNYYSDKAPGTAFLGVIPYAGFLLASKAPILGRGINWIEKSSAWNVAIDLGKSSTQVRPATRGASLGGCQRAGTAGNVQYIPWGNRLVPPFREWALSKYVISVLVDASIAAGFVAFLFWFLRFFTRNSLHCWLAAGSFAIATVFMPYATVFYSHALVAAFLFSAFGLLFLRSRTCIGPWAAPVAGFLLGFAFLTEYTVALVIAIVGAYALWTLRRSSRSMSALALAAAIPVAGLFAYNFAIFGNALDTGYTHDFCWSTAQGGGFAGFTYPRLRPLWDLTFGPYRGLFFTSPFLLLGLPGAFFMGRRGYRVEATVCILSAAIFILAISSYWGWNGGRVDGPRYLVPIVPFLAFPVVFLLDRTWRLTPWRLLWDVLVAWSVFATWAQFLGGSTFPTSWLRNPLLEYSLPELSANHITSNAGFFLGLSGWMSLLPLVGVLTILSLPVPIRQSGRRSKDRQLSTSGAITRSDPTR